jgi:predicted RNase H-like HicB family nuclease
MMVFSKTDVIWYTTDMQFTFTTTIQKEGKWYVAQCVELGVVSQGKTATEARLNLKEAVELYLEDMPVRDVPRRRSTVGRLKIVHA